MGHLVSKQPWFTLDVDTETGLIMVSEAWQYKWTNILGAKPFTIAERRNFHATVNRQIWGRWDWQFHPHLVGNGPLVDKFKGRTFTINFDVHWVLHNPQWTVEVIRVPAGITRNAKMRSDTDFPKREITLYSFSLDPYEGANDVGESRTGVLTVPHEWGHTFRGTDEYEAKSPFIGDTDSIMNTGRQLRERHILSILVVLNSMVPGALFML